jgi:hypothetical protein
MYCLLDVCAHNCSPRTYAVSVTTSSYNHTDREGLHGGLHVCESPSVRGYNARTQNKKCVLSLVKCLSSTVKLTFTIPAHMTHTVSTGSRLITSDHKCLIMPLCHNKDKEKKCWKTIE